ncbi:MAG TPA: glycosyltransferase, partial [Acidobacteriota bacterium]|nr:glycosyltransferase [Acidobacteriota bacterium]
PGTFPVTVSNFRATELQSLLGKSTPHIRVITNGVSVTQLLGLNTRTIELIHRLQLLNASPLILLPVRITPRKNIELALSIAAELRQTFPNLKLLVTGPPGPHNPANQDYFARLLSLRDRLSLTQHVDFLFEVIDDYLPEDVIYDFFRLADLLLLPSLEEGFGLPIIESSQVKLPIFCSDIPVLRELAGDEAHYFSPKASPTDAAGMITAYLKGNTEFQLRARLRRFDWKRLYVEQIEPLLREAGRQQ